MILTFAGTTPDWLSIRSGVVLNAVAHHSGIRQDKPRSASIKTLTPCVVISLSWRRFKRLVERFPAMQPAIDRRMARSVENLTSLQQSSSAAL